MTAWAGNPQERNRNSWIQLLWKESAKKHCLLVRNNLLISIRSFRDVIRGKIIRFDTGDELVIVPQVQQLLELPDIGGSEMFIRGVEHFQHDSSVTFNGHTQCLTGFTQVILESQPQRVVMRVGTLGQNGADRPQFIDTT